MENCNVLRKPPVPADVGCVGLLCCLTENQAAAVPMACCIGAALSHLMGAHTELISSRPQQKQGSRKDYMITKLSISLSFDIISLKYRNKFVGKPILR